MKKIILATLSLAALTISQAQAQVYAKDLKIQCNAEVTQLIRLAFAAGEKKEAVYSYSGTDANWIKRLKADAESALAETYKKENRINKICTEPLKGMEVTVPIESSF